MKKRRGSMLGDLLSSLLVILSFTILAFSFLNAMNAISRKENVKEVSRKYILDMETKGYLTTESSAKLLQELSEIGLTDIDLSGTTLSDAGYGNEIHLYIKGKMPVVELDAGGGDLFASVFRDTQQMISIHKMSTAKH